MQLSQTRESDRESRTERVRRRESDREPDKESRTERVRQRESDRQSGKERVRWKFFSKL